MSEIPNHPVYSKNVFEIITVANDFCIFLAKIETYSKLEAIDYLQKVCPLLYIKGALLPDVEVLNPDANERFVTEGDWETLFNELRKIFHPDDEFWFIDNSDINENNPIKGSLAEHFADIYQDLKDFLMLYQKNTLDSKENAVSELKRLFPIHWGLRIVNAMKTLHYISLNNLPTEEDNSYDIF
jgi:hypothetical protein